MSKKILVGAGLISEPTVVAKIADEPASSANNELVSVDSFNSDKRDAERYRYIRRHMEWRRSGGTGLDEDSHAFVGCRFPYYGNFECASMLDENIDKMIKREH